MPLGGETVGHVFVKVHADGTGLDKEIKDEFDDLDPVFADSAKSNSKSYNDVWTEEFNKQLAETESAEKKSLKRREAALKGWETRRRNQSAKTTEAVTKDLAKVEQAIEKVAKTSDDGNKHTRDWGNTLGKLFGKGSRNNFLNIVGSLVKTFTQMIQLLPKLGTQLGSIFGGDGPVDWKQFGKLAGSAAGGVGALAAVLVLITALAAPVAAAISGLAAALTAIVSSALLAAGAVGGVAFVLGTTLVGAVAVGIVALKNLDQQTKNMAKSVGDEFEKLGKSAGTSIGPGLRRALGILKPEIAGLKPLVDGISTALGGVAVSFAKITRSTAYKKFIADMTVFMPDAIGKLGEAGANFVEGFMGVLRGATPVTDRFLNWLVDASDRFNEWANSAKGQNSIKKFFDQAGDSAEAIGGLIDKAADAIVNLVLKASPEGDTIIDDLAGQLEDLSDWLQDPKNQQSIEDFFAHGTQFAEEMGTTIERLLELFDKLDGPNSRKAFSFLNSALQWQIQQWTSFTDSVSGLFDVIGWELDQLGKLKPDIKWGDLIPDISWGDLIPDVNWGDFIPKFGDAWSKFVNTLHWRDFIPNVKWSNFIPNIKWSSFIPNIKWSSLIPDVKWGDFIPDVKWGDLIPDIKWGDIIPDINWDDFVPDLNVHINWPDPPGWLSKLGAAVTPGTAVGGVFNGAQHRIIGEAGPEAVVPLRRPLSMVDPSVRALSAFAQGLSAPTGVSTNARSTERTPVTINVTTPASDAHAVALETMNYLTATAY